MAQLIHTGQHFSPEMSESFLRELEIPEPDINLDVGGGTHTQQTAEIMRRLDPGFEQFRPDTVLVVGDVKSTFAAALVAAKMGITIAHVETGLRSFDRRMPEEINRVVTDAVSDYLFTTEPSGKRNLLAEGIPKEKILDEPEQLSGLLWVLEELSHRLPVVFPVHPRSQAKLAGISSNGLMLTPPMGYLDFLRLMSEARLALTDSGGIQEETTILRIPCLTLRENTERPITTEQGTNRLVGVEPESILEAAWETLDADRPSLPPPARFDPERLDRLRCAPRGRRCLFTAERRIAARAVRVQRIAASYQRSGTSRTDLRPCAAVHHY